MQIASITSTTVLLAHGNATNHLPYTLALAHPHPHTHASPAPTPMRALPPGCGPGTESHLRSRLQRVQTVRGGKIPPSQVPPIARTNSTCTLTYVRATPLLPRTISPPQTAPPECFDDVGGFRLIYPC